jgi:hypothetical protein
MAIKSINSMRPPNLSTKALIADVQAYEPYGSSAFNRQLRGVIPKGIYLGFNLSPAPSGLSVVVSSSGASAAAIEVAQDWLINVRQRLAVTLAVPAGRISSVVLTAFYDGSTFTDQVDADSTVKAAQLLVVNAGSEPVGSLILGQLNVPSNAANITNQMINLDLRASVSLEGFWRETEQDHVSSSGKWIRTAFDKGIKPSLDKVRALATDFLGTPTAWFKESWVNTYRGGSIDVEGNIKSGGKLLSVSNNVTTAANLAVTGSASITEHRITFNGVEPVTLTINGAWSVDQRVTVTKTRSDSGLLTIASSLDLFVRTNVNAGKNHTFKGAGQFELTVNGAGAFELTRISGVK